MNVHNLTPTRLRLILIGSMGLLVALAVVVFMVGYKQISDYSAAARTVAAQAQASDSSLQDLVTVKKQLANNADVVQRASLLVAESKSYLYQDQIINDINSFASQAGVVVTNINFGGSGAAATSGASAAATPTAPGSGSRSSMEAAVPGGIKTTTASITVQNPVDYTKMLTFIHSIENSLFKMRLSQVTLSKATGSKGSNDVTSDVLNIEVYIR